MILIKKNTPNGKPKDIKVEDITFRDRVVELMNDKDIGQVQLAKLTDHTQGGIRHILIGSTYPGLKFVRNLLMSLPDVSAEWLVR
jgi:hypothetical protein